MTPTLRRKLEALAERREELERLLADPGVIGDVERFRNFSREFAQLEPVAVALAEGIRSRTGASFGVGITGIAGPDGGTAEKPVGTGYVTGSAYTTTLLR